MGREVRMVPEDWEHPKNEYTGKYEPLHCGYQEDLKRFKERIESHGLEDALDYWGGGPIKRHYMLADYHPEERTHLMMYEDTSEGTPISPAFETPEELAKWLADNGASSFGSMTATYEQWLETCKSGWAPSAIYTPETGLISGVEAIPEKDAI